MLVTDAGCWNKFKKKLLFSRCSLIDSVSNGQHFALISSAKKCYKHFLEEFNS